MIATNIEEIKQLKARYDALVLAKKEKEIALVAVKNLVRSSGRMPNEKYRQCCDSQTKHVRAIFDLESQMRPIKTRLREIADERHIANLESPSDEPEQAKGIVVSLVGLRQHYQEFASDLTRVSSMRQMASEFVLKLNPIIRNAIGGSSEDE